MDPTALSLVPPLVAIVLAFWTRQVLPALFFAIVTGGLVQWSRTGDHPTKAQAPRSHRQSDQSTGDPRDALPTGLPNVYYPRDGRHRPLRVQPHAGGHDRGDR